MYRIVKKRVLNPTVSLMEIEAPAVARKAEPGQFIILRVDEEGERIPLTIADFDRQAGTVTIIYQVVGATTEKLNHKEEGEFLQDHQILVAEAHDEIHMTAHVVELLGHGVGDGGAHAAAHNGDPLQALGLGGAAQGAHEVLEVLALLLVVQLLGGSAHELEDDGDSALLPVIGGDGQGDALAVFIHAEDDELAGLALPGHGGGLDLHQGYGGVQNPFFYDPIHSVSSFHLDSVAFFLRP